MSDTDEKPTVVISAEAVADVMSDDYWSLPIALAWVATRSKEELTPTLHNDNHVGAIWRVMNWNDPNKQEDRSHGCI